MSSPINALSSRATVRASYWTARQAIQEGIPGDLVECGVYAGAQAAAMAQAILDLGATDRRVHLFDSFQGIPEPGKHDHEFREVGHQAGLSSCSLDEVQNNMRKAGIPDNLLVYHPGWFNDTVVDSGINCIAVLRLDGDLYESTKFCLQHLYPLLSVGGWCIVDDYALSGCRKAVTEYLESTVGYAPMYWQKQ